MSRLVVDAEKKGFGINIKELIEYRDLFYILAYRDLRVRYAQTFLGFLWAILQPVATLIILFFVFGKALKVDTGDIPYPVFALAGLSMWTYFSFVLNQSGQSVIGAQEMIKKIFFPRLVIPLSKAVVGFVDFGITLIFLIVMMIVYGITPSANVFFAPIFILLNILAALSVGIWLSALTIRYRDFQHVIPFMVQFGLYATPVAYPATFVPEKYQFIYNLNPMAGVISGFRWCLFGGEFPGQDIYLAAAIIVILFISSLYYFKSVEDVMADIV
ncbi:MAG: ABC transporter permease [Cyclobacteriaceae bacterium]|nr:ABC transporter permease [Cyclobacteriaceae bacterium]